MIPLFWKKSKDIWSWLPRLQAHRGYWVDGCRENTLSSIQKAAELGYEMVEFDVRLAANDEAVLFHDEGLQQKLIAETTLEDLKKSIEINSFEEVLIWVTTQSQKIKLNIELKTDETTDGRLEKKVVQLVEKYQLVDQVLVSSFNPLSLARVRRLNKNIYRAQLLTMQPHPKNTWFLRNRFFNFLARPHILNLRWQDWNEKDYQFLEKKVPIVLWTYNDINGSLLRNSKIHGVISDVITPQLLK